jgi:CxxC motif-containing protein
MPQAEITCTGCPLGCRVTLKVGPEGTIENLTGNQCKEGKKYVAAEFQNPVRVFTATVLTEGGGRLLPVRTDKPVPKSRLKELMRSIAKVRVKPPVKPGQEIVYDILGIGANLVSTGTL